MENTHVNCTYAEWSYWYTHILAGLVLDGAKFAVIEVKRMARKEKA